MPNDVIPIGKEEVREQETTTFEIVQDTPLTTRILVPRGTTTVGRNAKLRDVFSMGGDD